ncbi:MAG: amino acid ABC transporter substrate-binding protein, partial [Campylobacter sp.]|nr:amino acid ABC transporter substrate-binding protein [Campylobacter sp.]
MFLQKALKFLAVVSLALCVSAFGENSLQRVKKDGAIKIATEGTYSPYSYHNEANELVGYDVDIARAVAKKIGVKAQFVEAPWDAMLAAFNAGKADAVFNQVSITDERKKKYDYSIPYTTAYGALVVHKDNDSIKSFDDLKGKKSAHSATSNWAQMAEKHGADIVTVDGFSKGVELIIAKSADATINDTVTFFDFVKQKPNAPIKIAVTGNEPIYSAALFHKGNDELVTAVSKALKELKDEG